jgi:hypothetical protein
VPLPAGVCPTTFDLYRPFGAAGPTATGLACNLVACLEGGRGAQAAANYLTWSHYLDVDAAVDVRDGCTRAAGADQVTYADGDEVRAPSGAGSTRYVVVWVEVHNRGTAVEFKRAYLLRHAATWPGP